MLCYSREPPTAVYFVFAMPISVGILYICVRQHAVVTGGGHHEWTFWICGADQEQRCKI